MVSVLTGSDFNAFAGSASSAFNSDTTSSSLDGVVVLSSTDCSSSSSACSGHSDITSDPGSPYSSPTSAALCSPEEFPGSHSEESEDSPLSLACEQDTLVTEEPRPPDPCWPPFDEEEEHSKPQSSPSPISCRATKKRPYPFCNNSTSTPKRFRNNSGNTGTTINVNHNNNISQTTNSNTTSLIPYQPVNLNSTHQKQSFQKLESKINNNLEPSKQQQPPPQLQQQPQQQQQAQQKWPLPKNILGVEGIKGQGKITEYFKTQIKSTLPTQKNSISPLTKKGQGQVKSSAKKDGIDKFLRNFSGNSPTAKEMCVQPVLVLEKDSRDSKILSLIHDTEPKRCKESASVASDHSSEPSELAEESKLHQGDMTPECQEQGCSADCSRVVDSKKRCHRRLPDLNQTKNGPCNGETDCSTKSSMLPDFSCKPSSMLSLLSTSVETTKILSDKEMCVVNRASVEITGPPGELGCFLDKVPPSLKKATTVRDSLTTVDTILSFDKNDKKAIHMVEVVESRSCDEVASSEAGNKTELATPLSPILSAPRVIRFPVPQRTQASSMDAVQSIRCCWSQCELEFLCTSKLLEHLQSQHVNTQMRSEQFVCLWIGCKVHARPSCSLSWLERHVLSHGGSKPFRCIVDGCGQRFSSQSSLERHVNSHFNAPSGVNGSGSTSSSTRRSADTVPNKLFRRNGKKLRYRRQPWSARMFDYIDTGMMEGLQHRLLTFTQQQLKNVTTEEEELEISQGNHVALRSKVLARRVETDGTTKFLVHWLPEDIIPDEWVSESEVKPSQLVPLSRLTPSASTSLHHSLLPPNSKSTRKPRKPQVTPKQTRSLS